jgi:flagellar basal-body rod protein FlgB
MFIAQHDSVYTERLVNGGIEMLFSKNMELLVNSLDWSAKRHKIIAHNVANADTPGYKRKDLTFPAQLKAKLELVRTDPKHLPARSVSGYRSFIDWGAVRVDDNNVDLEAEMVRLAENNLYYQGMAHQLSNNIKRLRTAIQGRG